jgi:alpha-ribazole phosphatase
VGLTLHLVRHPRPAVEAGICYGAADVPVDAAELDLARAALRAYGLPGQLPVYASPLGRCAVLARSLPAVSLRFDARLAEMDFGSWEMRAWSEIPRADVDAWAADLLHYRPGGGESVLDVAARVASFVDELRASAVPEALVICHAGTIRLLAAMREGLPLEQAALAAASTPHRIGFAQVKVLTF